MTRRFSNRDRFHCAFQSLFCCLLFITWSRWHFVNNGRMEAREASYPWCEAMRCGQFDLINWRIQIMNHEVVFTWNVTWHVSVQWSRGNHTGICRLLTAVKINFLLYFSVSLSALLQNVLFYGYRWVKFLFFIYISPYFIVTKASECLVGFY